MTMKLRPTFFSFYLAVLTLVFPWCSYGLEVSIQGQTLLLPDPRMNCMSIAGEYAGVRVEDSQPGKTAQVCQHYGERRNFVLIRDAVFVATVDNANVRVTFKHHFPPAPNGLLLARTAVRGTFTGTTVASVPSGARIELKGYVGRRGGEALIKEPMIHEVDEGAELKDAVFDIIGGEEFLVVGDRVLRADIAFQLKKAGQQLIIPERSGVIVEHVGQAQEELE